MGDIVKNEEENDPQKSPEIDRQCAENGAYRSPSPPEKAVAERTEGAAKRLLESNDPIELLLLVLCNGFFRRGKRRPERIGGQVGMGVEKTGVSNGRLPSLLLSLV